MKELTLCIIQGEQGILLGYKKRGFGEGKWNGFGGKKEGEETIEEAARRECIEEVGITPTYLQPVGHITFVYPQIGQEDLRHSVHIFMVDEYEGSPVETEEMRPQWFAADQIPYTNMWPDDSYWLPLVLEGKKVEGTFFFDPKGTITSHTLQERE